MVEKAVVIGAGGHSRVVMSVLKYHPIFQIIGVADKGTSYFGEKIGSSSINYTWEDLPELYNQGISTAFIAFGENRQRKKFYQKAKDIGFSLPALIHPKSIIEESASIGEGTLVCLGAKIGTQVRIGNNCIINTGSIIDHETEIDDDVFVGPGVNIAGRVKIDAGVFIGIGSSVIDKIHIGTNAVVGAGATVIRNVQAMDKVVGVPAKPIK